jgi:hypothetical protein
MGPHTKRLKTLKRKHVVWHGVVWSGETSEGNNFLNSIERHVEYKTVEPVTFFNVIQCEI